MLFPWNVFSTTSFTVPKTCGHFSTHQYSYGDADGDYVVPGIEYNIGRVPMASCDFSTHQYSYDDVDGDLELKHFALAPEDLKFKVIVFFGHFTCMYRDKLLA